MRQPRYILENGTKVITADRLDSTGGMLVNPAHLNVRKRNQRGTITGVVGGHGGDVYWVRHDDHPDETGAYCFTEFELAPFDPGVGGHAFGFKDMYDDRGRRYECARCGRNIISPPLDGDPLRGPVGPIVYWDGITPCEELRRKDATDEAERQATVAAKRAELRASCRILGTIATVRFGPDWDHRCPVFTAALKIPGSQSLQLTFDDDAQMRAFVRDFCATFGVADAELLAGKQCYALRCFNRSSASIEGIESVDTGRRLTKTAWWRANVDPNNPSPLQFARESIESEIARHQRRIEEAEHRLSTINADYVDWEVP